MAYGMRSGDVAQRVNFMDADGEPAVLAVVQQVE